jgi:ribonuclease Z
MEVRKAFWKGNYMIKNSPQWMVSGYSRSAYRTGFFVSGLNIMLDAGPQCFKKPEHIFITHSHADHIANLPFTLIGEESGTHKYNIYAPQEAQDKLKKYIKSMFEANALSSDIPVEEWYNFIPLVSKYNEENNVTQTLDVVSNKNKLSVEIVKCDHGIPTVSYGFGLKKHKLNPKYKGLKGKEIGQLRKDGVDDITVDVLDKIFAFVCDTSIKVFDMNPFILDYSTIFIECTFLKEGEEDTATSKKHIHWKQLKPYVLDNKDTTFVLFHFSLKYKDEEIKEIMEEEFKTEGINNVDLWLVDTI